MEKKDLKKYKIEYDYLYLRKSPKDDHQMFKSDIKQMLFEKVDLRLLCL